MKALINTLGSKTALKIAFAFVLLVSTAHPAQANPFFGNSGNNPAPPAVSGGSGAFTGIQFEYREKIASVLRDIKNGEKGMMMILLTASFLYGIFHAAGPGHRKTVIFSLFLSKKAGWYEPAAAGFLSAGIHAGASIFLILGILFAEKTVATLSGTDSAYVYMEGFTFIILAVMAGIFIVIKACRLFADGKENSHAVGEKGFYPAIIITSLVPCPGATMLLIFALYLDLLLPGIAGVIAMSLGMGMIISVAGYIAFAGREGLFMRLKRREAMLKTVSSVLEMFSFFIILAFSLYMAWPFIRSLLR